MPVSTTFRKPLAEALNQLTSEGLTVKFESYPTGVRITITDGDDELSSDGATAQEAWDNARGEVRNYW